MPQGLLAQWQRGIALRGIAGAFLLMVPVVIAATIGFGGGVGVGLSSAIGGPSETPGTAVDTAGTHSGGSASLDKLAAAISPIAKQTDTGKKVSLSVPSRGVPNLTGGSNPVLLPPAASGSGTPSAGPTPQADPAISPGGGEATTPVKPSGPLSGSSNPLADLLNGLLGGSSPGS